MWLRLFIDAEESGRDEVVYYIFSHHYFRPPHVLIQIYIGTIFFPSTECAVLGFHNVCLLVEMKK